MYFLVVVGGGVCGCVFCVLEVEFGFVLKVLVLCCILLVFLFGVSDGRMVVLFWRIRKVGSVLRVGLGWVWLLLK